MTTPTEPPKLPSSATSLKRLHADLARVAEKHSALNASSARLRDAANAEAAVLQEIGELGSAEIAAMTAWATAGCIGEPPAPDQKQLRALSEKLAAAQAATAAAKGAGKDIDDQIIPLNAQLKELNVAIEIAALDAVQEEMTQSKVEHLHATERYRKATAKVVGLRSHLSQEGRNRIDRGDQDGGRLYLARAEAISGKLPLPGVNQIEVIEAANDWSIRIAVLRKGAA